MPKHIIEKWWSGLGIWGRSQVCEVPFNGKICCYFEFTENWWAERTEEEKEKLYNDFRDKKRKFWFGKYKGRAIVDIINEDFSYIQWCITNVLNFNLTDEENKLYQQRKKLIPCLSDEYETVGEYRDSFVQNLSQDFIDPNPFADLQSF